MAVFQPKLMSSYVVKELGTFEALIYKSSGVYLSEVMCDLEYFTLNDTATFSYVQIVHQECVTHI